MASLMRNIFLQMRSNPEVIPLVTIVSFACSIGVGSLIRVSMVNSEISFDHKSNPYPFMNVDPGSKKCVNLFDVVGYKKMQVEIPPKY
ncbi:cytochrome c oxidase subunit NDUFA4-like [Dysidea avara]|uniref:cytochrome c oxidase subunit NDUFA4-like n=1 Tax=Dysidea avara TaxID=196820 RepID=UPI003320D88C